MSSVTVLDHPLIRARLTRLRDKTTGHDEFRRSLHEIAELMAFEVTRSFETREVEVATPITTTTGYEAARPVVLVPILRAGLGMLEGLLRVIPDAHVGHIGMYRDKETLQPKNYYCKMPPNLAEADVILIDPMLATGNSGTEAARQLLAQGATRIHFLSLLSAPEGIKHFHDLQPDIPIYTAAIEEKLNKVGYIVPGLGDAGDRYFGTV